ncbi:MAG: NAD-dependent epimerase/dehydratase family protein [Candidatus Omnitrophica bacterium]|nr:NAD-dependent epimerase/dehydratase family protein [Candidatus Omnitrophota bacterium]
MAKTAPSDKIKKPGIPVEVSDTKKAEASKLISIRMPKEMMEKLRGTAQKQGNLGYQKLIKNYITQGLAQTEGRTDDVTPVPSEERKIKNSPQSHRILKEELGRIGTPYIQTTTRSRVTVPDQTLSQHNVIAEDIENLARFLSPYFQDFSGKRFLITGAFGFLGKYMVHLLKYLNDHVLAEKASALLLDNFVTGYEQQVLLDKHLQFVRHDVIQPFDTDADIDYIIHMAGIASPAYYTKYPIETMDVGTVGTRHMLELAAKKNVKSFLFTSSSEVYGDPDPAHVPTGEDYHGNVSVNGPRSCYDESKRFGETMCAAFYRVYNLPVKIVRPFNVYGPGIRPDDFRVLPNFIEHALRKEPLPVHGEGRNTRSFCYINDAVEAIFRVLFSNANGEAFNIGNPSPEISVKELATKVAKAMPYKVDVVKIDAPHAVYATSDPKRRCPNISKLQKATDFKPKYTLDEGLQRTIQWFQER